ncbi:twin-arginine translocation signal domain-containing protein [Halosimplex rubrum]|uniref:Twin-arginine translocation signal domain-containing protein n=1 Tax=Halosimplex rubrum TaxID=869889 RepID=A0A7D5T0G6_9EURY|nr:twin-arginine translocation signal domain-containing protein [Halosimplex rubrum]QLH79531.1 twin-arginine translocation signal domain-containing protein [Halosimplex rubrum]
MPSRRDMLRATAGAAALSATAGCLGTGPSAPVLNCLSATNDTAESQTVHVLVEHEGELAAWETVDLAGQEESGASRKWVERTWPAEPAPFLVRARVEGRDGRKRGDSAELADGNYIHYDFEVETASATLWKNSVPDPGDQCAGAPVATDTPRPTR